MGYCFLSIPSWWTVECCNVLFSLRICIDPNDEIKAGLLAQAESGEELLQVGQWQHLGLTYTQQPEGKKNIHGRVVVWVCGIRWGKCGIERVRLWQTTRMSKTVYSLYDLWYSKAS